MTKRYIGFFPAGLDRWIEVHGLSSANKHWVILGHNYLS